MFEKFFRSKLENELLENIKKMFFFGNEIGPHFTSICYNKSPVFCEIKDILSQEIGLSSNDISFKFEKGDHRKDKVFGLVISDKEKGMDLIVSVFGKTGFFYECGTRSGKINPSKNPLILERINIINEFLKEFNIILENKMKKINEGSYELIIHKDDRITRKDTSDPEKYKKLVEMFLKVLESRERNSYAQTDGTDFGPLKKELEKQKASM